MTYVMFIYYAKESKNWKSIKSKPDDEVET